MTIDSVNARALDLVAHPTSAHSAHALATVFRAEGGWAGEVGANLLIAPGGAACGSVADSVLRDALRQAGAGVLAEGCAALVPLSSGSAQAEALVEYLLPPPRLVIFGGGPDVDAMVRQGAAVGWHVIIANTRTEDELRGTFPAASEWVSLVHADQADRGIQLTERTAAVVMTHNFVRDRMLLDRLVRSSAGYIGVVGNRQRFDDLLADLAHDGAPVDASRDRMFGPAGLDVGAENPEQIALAIVAEAHAVLAGRAGGFLRERARRGEEA